MITKEELRERIVLLEHRLRNVEIRNKQLYAELQRHGYRAVKK